MHSCWSPVQKCRPSFQQLVGQLEVLWLSLSPAPTQKETLLYVNLEGEEEEVGREEGEALGGQEATPSWGVPWQRRDDEDGEKDRLIANSEAVQAIGGDYRYIIGPCGAVEGEGGGRGGESMVTLEEDEDDDNIIHV